MASNRVIVDPNGRHFSADSKDRFGDDLCELIVGYLPNEEKHLFESVSKQWQRLVFNKIRHIVVVGKDFYRFDSLGKNKVVIRCDAEDNTKDNTEDNTRGNTKDRLKALLKKCRYVRHIELRGLRVNESVFAVIADNCPALESMSIRDCI